MGMIKPSHKGLLHKKLGIAQGHKIPEKRIKSAEHSASPALRKEAQFADNMDKDERRGGSRGTVPRGEHHADNHRAPANHAEFHRLGNPKGGC